jgi:hypothetical protein
MFRVRWKQSVLKELASIWIAADAEQRRAITEATDLIDRQLQRNPGTAGESRPNYRRIFFAPPLGVLFRFEAQNRVVRVLQVWRY